MSIDSGAEALPRKNRRVAKRNVEGDISPVLRKHVTQAAKKIRGAHKSELADVLKADSGRPIIEHMRPVVGYSGGGLVMPGAGDSRQRQWGGAGVRPGRHGGRRGRDLVGAWSGAALPGRQVPFVIRARMTRRPAARA
jgi:hypothetical protein